MREMAKVRGRRLLQERDGSWWAAVPCERPSFEATHDACRRVLLGWFASPADASRELVRRVEAGEL